MRKHVGKEAIISAPFWVVSNEARPQVRSNLFEILISDAMRKNLRGNIGNINIIVK